MKKITAIEIYYDDGSMEKLTSDQEVFCPIVEEIIMTKNLFETVNNIHKEYLNRVREICEP